MNPIRNVLMSLGLGLGLLAGSAHAAIGSADNVPAATLLIPHFEVDLNGTGARTHFTIGNSASTEQLAHVTLWTDYGVPTYSFDVRLPSRGVVEVDLGDLFINGTLPQSSPGAIPLCGSSLPPAPLDAATLTGLQNAHSGRASSLFGGLCAASNSGQARGYATVDVANVCTSQFFPNAVGYFISGGLGIAGNQNVLFGEYGVTNTREARSFGETAVHIEASDTDPLTSTPGNYTFYGRLVSGSASDNREPLPSNFMARFVDQSLSNPNAPVSTRALIWRDPGRVNPFACGSPPAPITGGKVVMFNHQEQVYSDRSAISPTRATQVVPITGLPYDQGMLAYELGFTSSLFPTNQAWVSHVFTSVSSLTTTREEAQSNAQPLNSNNGSLPVTFPQCNDGLDNDSDGRTDFPADPDCATATSASETASICNDGIDNDGDTLIDFPADPGCASRFAVFESTECSDGQDNDMDGQIDFPADLECASAADISEELFNFECGDGIDNSPNGLIDFGADPGCFSPGDAIEGLGVCSDLRDNDSDGLIDFPADPGCFNQFDNNETNAACSDGLDNDSDGRIDFPNDPGCSSATSNTESPQCSDGLDNDMDGDTDFPNDLGCLSASSPIEGTQCDDGNDNDGDMLIDFPADPGCASPASTNERPECNDTFENDGDGFIDFPADPGCSSASGQFESGDQCSDGIDNDSDGLTDFPNSPNCISINDGSEAPACSDGVDNDQDGVSDFPADPGCASALDASELLGVVNPACSDGIDNDDDLLVDFPADPGCSSAADDVEFAPNQVAGTSVRSIPVAGPFGLALMVLLVLLAGIGFQRRRQANQG
ncbi:MAG: hypothetical protein IPK97_08755 [Ahniella sp.]|nr:hypothetical protein [Ahniella sp.]